MSRNADCLSCKGKGYHSHNINFGSGPSCYSRLPCDVCKGSGRNPSIAEETTDE